MRKIITSKIEHIHKDLFEEYSSALSELIGRSPGVYAMYNRGELYYVGKATHLIRRVGQHLKDKHAGKWTHFSIFLTANKEHVSAIESVLISVAYPEGNSIQPKGDIDASLKRKLKRIIQRQQSDNLDRLMGHKSVSKSVYKKTRAPKRSIKNKSDNPLAYKFKSGKTLRGQYKGKTYKAILHRNGNIKYAGKIYTSPTGPAKKIIGRSCNGRHFWKIQDKNGDWVRLRELK